VRGRKEVNLMKYKKFGNISPIEPVGGSKTINRFRNF